MAKKIGRWIEDHRSVVGTKEIALVEAEEHFGCDYETCRKASSYAQHFDRYKDTMLADEDHVSSDNFQKFGLAWTELMFHEEEIERNRVKKKRGRRSGYRS